MLKVIFLDIDGVLNSDDFARKHPDPADDYHRIDPVARDHLIKLVHASGAKLVITSAWRISRPLPAIRRCLQLPVFSATSNYPNSRGGQILEWLREYPCVSEYVVLDDEVSDLTDVKQKVVHVSSKTGLRYEDTQRALEILQGVFGF